MFNILATGSIFMELCLLCSHTHACLPWLNNARGGPFQWPLFGREVLDNKYNKEADQKSKWSTSDWIQKHKYALELHNITTKDGYELQIHRIPQPGYRPVILVHGLLTSSLSWVVMGPNRSLAFLLYDNKYDVWLANLRGSSYGRYHQTKNASVAEFWNFSFHEIGMYDLPPIIDYIRDESSFHQIILIGHSQAFNSFLVLCSVFPEYNDRILLIQALAPIAQLKDNTKLTSQVVKSIMKYIKTKSQSNSHELFRPGQMEQTCLKSSLEGRTNCIKALRKIVGIGQHSFDSIFFGKLIQGGAVKEIKHLQQLWKSGDFIAYDFGPDGNRQYYNSINPYNYDLELVKVPVLLHFGKSDALSTPSAVHHIYSRMLKSVFGVYGVASEEFNHLDFFCANDVRTLVNDKVIDLMEKYMAGKLHYITYKSILEGSHSAVSECGQIILPIYAAHKVVDNAASFERMYVAVCSFAYKFI